MQDANRCGVYGTPSSDLVELPPGAEQLSPLIPGSARLEDFTGAFVSIHMLAPPGTVERRYALALALRALEDGGELVALAPKDKGGSRLAEELAAFGINVMQTARRHHRICYARRGPELEGIDAAIEAGGPCHLDSLGLWSQPGVFAYDRIDPGSALLIEHLPKLAGRGADFGCGLGILARAVLASADVRELALIDLDRRAIDAARRNVTDTRASFHWADLRRAGAAPSGLDFVVMNPPFHDGGAEDRSLGQRFVEQAAANLRKGGSLWMTANRHLPYEETLGRQFRVVRPVAEEGGYKIFEAIR